MSDDIDAFLKRQLPADAAPEIVELQRDALVSLTKSQLNERVGTASARLAMFWTFTVIYGLVGLASVTLWTLGAAGLINVAPEFVESLNVGAVGSGFIGGTKFVIDALQRR